MIANNLWWALVQASILCGLVLVVGVIVLWFIRQPADRLRVIEWVLLGCMIAPWLPGISSWKIVSLNVLQRKDVDHSDPRVSSAHSPSETTKEVLNPEPKTVNESIASEATPLSREVATTPAPVGIHPTSTTSDGAVNESHAINTESPIQEQPNQNAFPFSSISSLVLAAYLSVVTGMMGWWAIGLKRRSRLERSARPASLELEQKFASMTRTGEPWARLLVSDEVSGPMTWGLIRPVVVIPSRLTEIENESQLRWSLAHELSHIERRDIVTLLLASLVQLICFYQPFYWWLRRQMSLCQDFLADAKAARETDSAEDYAEFLVRLARSRIQPSMPASLGIAEGKSGLYRRIQFLLTSQGTTASSCSRITALCSAVTAVAFFGLLTTISLEADDSKTKSTENAQLAHADVTAAANKEVEETPSKQPEPASPSTAKEIQKNDRLTKNLNKIAAFALNPVDESQLEQGVVTGLCVNASTGDPVPNATVILHAGRSDKTKTNEQGEFRLEKIPAREYAYPVWAHQGNLVSKKFQVSALRNKDPKIVKFAPLVMEMTEGKKARFAVTSEVTKQPVAGANVRFGYPDRRLVKTDENGIATVEGLLPESYEVSIEAAGHARNAPSIDLSAAGAETEFNISLKRGGVVRGTVIDADDKPVSGVNVSYFPAGGHTGYSGDDFVTDDEGRFQNSYLPLDTAIKISISKKGYLPNDRQITASTNNRELEVQLTLTSRPIGGSIRGTITDREGKPIADAEVQNYGTGTSETRKTTTSADGTYELKDLLPGFGGYQVVIMARGYAPQHLNATPGTVEKPGAVDVKLEPGHKIHGRIELEDGTSPLGAHILARSPQFGMMPDFRAATADEKGNFEFDSLPDDARFDVNIGQYYAVQRDTWKLDGTDPIIVKIAAPGVIRGRVLDEQTKQPITDYRIKLGFSRQNRPTDPRGTYHWEWGERGLAFNSTEGEFAFTPLVVGFPAELTVDAPGYDRAVVERAVAAKRDQADLIDIYAKPLKSGKTFTLKGQMLNHLGQPAPHAELRLIVSTEQPQGANDNKYNWVLINTGHLEQKSYCAQFLPGTTDADGRFEFRGIQAERYLQLAYWGKGVPRGRSLAFDETVAGGKESVTIRLPQPARVTGTIDRTKIPDADGVRLNLQTIHFHDYELKLAEDQIQFEFDDLPPGKYWISVTAKPATFTKDGNTFFSSANIASKQLQLKPGQTEDVKFTEPDKPKN